MRNFKYYPCEKIHDLREMFVFSTSRYADHPFFYKFENDAYRTITYTEFRHDVNSLGAAFLRRGLDGKKIIIMGENSYEWCVTYMAVACGLGITVPVDKEISAEDLAAIAKDSGVSAIVFSEKCREKAMGAGRKLQKFSFEDIFDICKREDVYSEEDYLTYFNRSINIDELSAIVYTAGTAGTPKGVMLSQRNICSNLEGHARLVNFTDEDRVFSVMPLHHVYECTAGFLFPMSRGASIAFPENAKSIMKNIKELSPTKLLCVPVVIETLYRKIWENIRKHGNEKKVRNVIKIINLVRPETAKATAQKKVFSDIHASLGGNLNLIISVGSPVDSEALRGIRDFGLNVIQEYGLTECAPLVAANPDTAPKDNSVGVVLPGGELKIVAKDECGIGEIYYRGDNVMLGYYKQPELTDEIKKNGWLGTGDLGYIDEDGYLVVIGRKKNAFTVSGKTVYPEEIEMMLRRNPFVSECAVVGVMNGEKNDNDVIALIYPDFDYVREAFGRRAVDPKLSAEYSKLVDGVNSLLPSHKKITSVIIRTEEFAKTSSRKIKRTKLAEYARS